MPDESHGRGAPGLINRTPVKGDLRCLFKKIIFLLAFLAVTACASILDGRFVTPEGKPSPFQPQTKDVFEPPREPQLR